MPNLNIFIFVLCGLILRSDATWGTWEDWSSCSTTCGVGVRTRARTCHGELCLGPSEMHKACMEKDCEEEENTWSVWGLWSECSQTCGGGVRTRERMCGSGNPEHCCEHQNEESCRLEYFQSRECVNDDCFGSWSDWRQWGACSAKCGEGVQSRSRDCLPSGSVCLGGSVQQRFCYVQCPVSDKISKDSGASTSCVTSNPCQNGGSCMEKGNDVFCRCHGNWRGRVCNSMCLASDDHSSCSNKAGIFHDCDDCSKFVICFRGLSISMPCVTGRIWTGSGCKLPEETQTLCLNQTNT